METKEEGSPNTDFDNKDEYYEFIKHLVKNFDDVHIDKWDLILIGEIDTSTADKRENMVRNKYIHFRKRGGISVNGSTYKRTIRPEKILELHDEEPSNFTPHQINERASTHLINDFKKVSSNLDRVEVLRHS